MAWGSGDLKSCSKLLGRIEDNDPRLIDLVILPPPLKVFTSQDASRLASALARNGGCKLKGLVIPHNLADCLESVKIIGSCLVVDGVNNDGLRELDLGNEKFGDIGANSLATGIELKRKDFITSSTSLVSINFSKKGLTGQGMEALGSALSPSFLIKNIDLSGNTGAISFCSSALAKMKSSTNEKTHSSPFPCLEIINIANCSIGKVDETSHQSSRSIATFLGDIHGDSTRKKNCSLELNLSGNDIFADLAIIQQIDHLIRHGVLTKLDISGNLVHGKIDSVKIIADALKSEDCRLSSLNFSNCGLDEEGAKIMASALSLNKSLKELKIANNQLGNKGAERIASALGSDALSSKNLNDSLRFLDMSNTNIGLTGVTALLSTNNLNGLRLFGNKIEKNFHKIIGHVGSNNSLKSLDLGGNNCSAEDLLALIDTIRKENNTLTLLEIGGNTTNEEVLSAIILLREVKPHLDVAHDKMPSGEVKG